MDEECIECGTKLQVVPFEDGSDEYDYYCSFCDDYFIKKIIEENQDIFFTTEDFIR